MQKLTEKQKRFADYYIETGNGTESAKRAGYKAKDLRVIASENLTKPNIKTYIDEKISKKDKQRIASQDEVLEFLSAVQRGEITEEVVCPDGMGGVFRQNKNPSVKDRIKAAEMLAKRYGIDKPKIDLSNTNIQIDITDNDKDED